MSFFTVLKIVLAPDPNSRTKERASAIAPMRGLLRD